MKPVTGGAVCHSSSPTPPSMTGGLVALTASSACEDAATPPFCAHAVDVHPTRSPHANRATVAISRLMQRDGQAYTNVFTPLPLCSRMRPTRPPFLAAAAAYGFPDEV